MNGVKDSLFADLTLAELWSALKTTTLVCVFWGFVFGVVYFLSLGGASGSETLGRWIGFEDGKLPTPIYVGLFILALVIWPGFFSNIVKDTAKSLNFTLTGTAEYWEKLPLVRRIGAAAMLSIVLLLLVSFPIETWVVLAYAIIFLDQVHQVKWARQKSS